MKKQRKIYFLMTTEQWLGFVLLAILVVGTLVIVKHFQPTQEVEARWTNDSTKMQFTDYQLKQDSLRKVTHQ